MKITGKINILKVMQDMKFINNILPHKWVYSVLCLQRIENGWQHYRDNPPQTR